MPNIKGGCWSCYSELAKLGYDFQQAGDQIAVTGKSVHAKLAPQGVNAITPDWRKHWFTLVNLPINFGYCRKSHQTRRNGEKFGRALYRWSIRPYDFKRGQYYCDYIRSSRVRLDIRYPVTLEKQLWWKPWKNLWSMGSLIENTIILHRCMFR